MKNLQVACFLLLIGFSTFSFAVDSKVTLNFYGLREKGDHKPHVLSIDSKVTVKCEQNLTKEYSNKLDIYSVSHKGFQTCNATKGKLLGTIKCGVKSRDNINALNFVKKGKTYYLIGLARKQKNPQKRVLHGGSCQKLQATRNTKLILHFRKQAANTTSPLKVPSLCKADHCSNVPFSTCLMHKGKPHCKCIQSCTLDLVQVCGTDGVTYQNECELKRTACLNKTQIKISKRQPCSEAVTCKRKCAAPYSRCVFHNGTKERCECIQGCPFLLKQVCGSDSVTYDNECLLKKTACEKNEKIKVAKNGKCRATTHKPKPSCNQECPKGIKRVCGSDNVTYDNKCLLKKAACEKKKEIKVLKNGGCRATTHKPMSPCKQACPKAIKRVCGSDNVTYDNKCLLNKAACEKKKEIKVVKNGRCRATTQKPTSSCKQACPKAIKRVCGSDNVTYDNKCLLNKRACEKKKEIKVVKNGRCRVTTHKPKPSCNQECSKAIERVCGSDNVTYDNKCLLNKAACEKKKEIKVVKNGRCRATTHKPKPSCNQECPKVIERVCGSDNVTYDNKCLLNKRACEKKKEIKVVKKGRCREATTNKPKPSCIQGCPKNIDHVCGSDNVTYDNKCLLEKTACENKEEITVVKNEKCEGLEFTTNAPKPSCIQECPKDIDQVCGSDNVTYDNKCLLEKTACENKEEITIVKNGKCEELEVTTNAPKPSCIQECPKDIDQVCGSDNVTYDNKCLLEKTACENKEEITIVKNGKCQEASSAFETQSSCGEGCPKDLQQVCGSDDVTYDNKCLLEKTACEEKKEITVVKNGTCKESVSCEKECPAPYSRCVIRNGTEQSCECVQECSKIRQQVCGTDRVTYDNKCLLEKAACENNKEISVLNNGICIDSAYTHTELCGDRTCPPYSKCRPVDLCVCPKCSHDGKKVCGSDGKTYQDFCKLQKVACQTNTTITMAKKRPCEECAGKICPPYAKCEHSDGEEKCVCPDCTPLGVKVCGSDGKTYWHSCELKRHACKKNKRISVVKQGACVEHLSVGGSTEQSEDKKSTRSFRTLYISMAVVVCLGVAIALVMCMFQRGQSRTPVNRRNISRHHGQDKKSFKSLHSQYRAGSHPATKVNKGKPSTDERSQSL